MNKSVIWVHVMTEASMIGHLLTLNRAESGISVLGKKKIDLAKMIREIVDDADFEAKSLNRGVKYTVIEACFMEGDENLLRRAIKNVTRNVVRYTQDGNGVEVSLRCIHNRNDSRGLITIRDHGKEVTGAAVRLHGGTICAANSCEGGLIIEISLPLLPGRDQRRSCSGRSAPGGPQGEISREREPSMNRPPKANPIRSVLRTLTVLLPAFWSWPDAPR